MRSVQLFSKIGERQLELIERLNQETLVEVEEILEQSLGGDEKDEEEVLHLCGTRINRAV